jgi:hypothetical protein
LFGIEAKLMSVGVPTTCGTKAVANIKFHWDLVAVCLRILLLVQYTLPYTNTNTEHATGVFLQIIRIPIQYIVLDIFCNLVVLAHIPYHPVVKPALPVKISKIILSAPFFIFPLK